MKSPDLYRCHHCSSLNESLAASWCLCTGGRSLICSHCGQCVCGGPAEEEFWSHASPALLARRETYASPVVREFTDQALAGRVVLVVDDDRLVHAIVDRVMTGFDGILLHAYTGTDALRIAWQVRPNLILTDALLPGVDGRELSKAVKSEPALSHTTVIVMTALYKGARYRQEAFTEYLVDGYVEKPLSAMKLRSTIEGSLEHDAAVQESIETKPQAQEIAN